MLGKMNENLSCFHHEIVKWVDSHRPPRMLSDLPYSTHDLAEKQNIHTQQKPKSLVSNLGGDFHSPFKEKQIIIFKKNN